MQASSFFHPLSTTGSPFSGTLRRPNKSLVISTNRRHPVAITMAAFKKDGKMVDDNMIFLRERIKKLEMECGDDRLPENWMQWEKTYVYSGCYHSDVYQLVAFMQGFLMESRPGVVLGLVAVFVIGGSTTSITVLHQLITMVLGNN